MPVPSPRMARDKRRWLQSANSQPFKRSVAKKTRVKPSQGRLAAKLPFALSAQSEKMQARRNNGPASRVRIKPIWSPPSARVVE